MNKNTVTFCLFLIFTSLLSACQQIGHATNPTNQNNYELINGLKNTQIEIAITQEQKEHGLMNRLSLPINSGMLFVFEQSDKLCFWMKNTLIPLSIGFIDENGVLLQTEEMQAQSSDTHCAKQPARYALEMNADWFKQNNIRIGSKILSIRNKKP